MSKAILDNPVFDSERPLFERRKAVILVEVDLDPVPGAMHTPEDAEKQVADCLESIKQYNPKTVSITTLLPAKSGAVDVALSIKLLVEGS